MSDWADWADSVAAEIVADVATDDPALVARSPEARAVVAGAVARALRKDVEAPRSSAGDWTGRAVRAAYVAGIRDGVASTRGTGTYTESEALADD